MQTAARYEAASVPALSRMRMRMKRYWFLYILLLPAVLYYAIYRFYPTVLQVALAFKQFRLADGVWGSPWVGFGNFAALLAKPEFYPVLRNTVEISLLRLAFGFWPPIVLAIFLFELRSRLLRSISQTILYIPHFFSWVIVYAVTFALFSNLGAVNHLLGAFGGHEQNFLLSPHWFRPILIGTGIWKEVGWGTIIYLAALTSIDPSLYEAAKVDGAGPWSRLVHVTLPGILPVVVFLFTLQLGSVLHAGAEQVLLQYNPATYGVGDIIDTWVYRQGVGQLQYSLATAMSLFQSAFGLLLVLAANRVARKTTGTGIW